MFARTVPRRFPLRRVRLVGLAIQARLSCTNLMVLPRERCVRSKMAAVVTSNKVVYVRHGGPMHACLTARCTTTRAVRLRCVLVKMSNGFVYLSVPWLTTCRRRTSAPLRLSPGVARAYSYHQHAGGKWSGDYYIADWGGLRQNPES